MFTDYSKLTNFQKCIRFIQNFNLVLGYPLIWNFGITSNDSKTCMKIPVEYDLYDKI